MELCYDSFHFRLSFNYHEKLDRFFKIVKLVIRCIVEFAFKCETHYEMNHSNMQIERYFSVEIPFFPCIINYICMYIYICIFYENKSYNLQ